MWIKLRLHFGKNKLYEPHRLSPSLCIQILLIGLFILFPLDILHFYDIIIRNRQIRNQISLFYSIFGLFFKN